MNAQRNITAYRCLSKLYPKSFRDEYGDDLIATFTEQLRDERASRLWLSTIRDLAVTVPTQHLEVHMNRPTPRIVAVIASTVTVASLAMAMVTGTGAATGVFLLIAVASLVVATLAWKATHPAGQNGPTVMHRWRTILSLGIGLVTAVIVVINVPPYNDRDLPSAGWALMMLSLVTGVALITVGLTMGVARRSTRHAAAP